ncbi:MAG: hypothetical protein LBQ09_08290 [Acidobacteriaceae bacterium]|jgi:hypothetical protein|nr:hypothetical protein [Acidobacteriaceae bacterium]
MLRTRFACCAIVAAFQLRLVAAPSVEDVPLTPAVVAVAAEHGVDRLRDRARFIPDVVQRLYPAVDGRVFDTNALIASASSRVPQNSSSSGQDTIAVPLGLEVWSRAIFKRTIPADRLLATILADPRAALLCRGLTGMDDETLTFVAEHPALLTFLYERAAPVVGGFGDVLRVHHGALVLPGGDAAAALWSAVLTAPLADGDRAARVLFGEFGGRLAYLAETIDSAEPQVARFALGAWIADPARRLQRFQKVADLVKAGYREWNAMERPFSRPLGDLGQWLLRINVDVNGAPVGVSDRQFWSGALDVSLPSGSVDEGDARIDLAWLLDATVSRDMYTRSDRLDQFSFGQRVFAAVAGDRRDAAMESIRGFQNRRALLLALERLGSHDPALYRAAVQRADALDASDAGQRFWTYAQYQGLLAIVARMARVGTIDSTHACALIASVTSVPLGNDGYDGALVDWFTREFPFKAEGDRASLESGVLDALGGPSAVGGGPRVEWEGQAYRFNPAVAERQRLEIVRRKQGGHTIDLAVAIARVVPRVEKDALTGEQWRAMAAALRAIASDNARQLKNPPVYLMPAGVSPPHDPVEVLTTAAADLERAARSGDLRRATRTFASLRTLADLVFGNALISLVYASEIGDPDGAALLAGNVSLRHDFGLSIRDGTLRVRQAWALPRQDFQPGVPWHVTGSLLNLDVALASLQLRHRTMERILTVPKLSSLDRAAMSVNVVLLDPRTLSNDTRDGIAAAMNEGRRRVMAAVSRPQEMAAIADELGLDGWRRRALVWVLDHDRESIDEQFTLIDLVTLGSEGRPRLDLDPWGVSGLQTEGCICAKMPTPRSWRLLEGRYQLPTVAATMGDLGLAVAVALQTLRLPAPLARTVLAVSMQDFIDEMTPFGSGDYWGLAKEARHLSPDRVEDYVANAAAVDGPLIPEDSNSSR